MHTVFLFYQRVPNTRIKRAYLLRYKVKIKGIHQRAFVSLLKYALYSKP